MSRGTGIHQTIKQNQKLIMSYAMQRAFMVLQMPILELSNWLESEIEQNPLLEITYPQSYQDEDFLYRQSLIETKTSLYEHVLREIALHFEDPTERKLATYLAGLLDEKGFLTTPKEEICASQSVSPELFECVLSRFQQMDPLGLGTRTLREALLIQLRAQSKERTLTYHLIDSHYEDLMSHRFSLLAKKFHLGASKLKTMMRKELRELNFFPGQQFGEGHNPHITPDLYLEKNEDHWEVRMNEDDLPAFQIHTFYLEKLKQDTLGKDDLEFIRRHLASGKWLLRTLDRRKKLLKDIGAYLLKKQIAFLESHSSSPLPMTMREVAHLFEVNESTVTRAIANKYVSCPRGLMKLRDFFTQGIQTEQGTISNKQAKDLLLKLVKSENKEVPLSDLVLSEQMMKQGIPCARRTVAKYRKELKIAPAAQRRENV